MASNPHNLQPNQPLWYVPDDKRDGSGREIVIASIGRRWASTVCGMRFDLESLRADGGQYSSPGRCCRSSA